MRIRGIIGLCIFVLGMLVLTSAHRLELSGGVECSHSECCSCVSHHDSEDSPREGAESSGHDSDSCPICKLANLPLLADSSVFDLGVGTEFSFAVQASPVPPLLLLPRLLPYACGPPQFSCP